MDEAERKDYNDKLHEIAQKHDKLLLENILLKDQLDIANKKLDKLDNEIKSVIKIVRQQPSESVEDDAWILGRLDSFLSIIWSD